jgi:hypothetical protein
MTSQGISQTSDSVTCIPNVQLRKAINLIENAKVLKEELEDTKQINTLLNKRIQLKDSIILKYGIKEINWKRMDSNYQKQIENDKNYQKNTQKIFEIQRSQIRRQKFSKWAMLVAGVGAGYLISK